MNNVTRYLFLYTRSGLLEIFVGSEAEPMIEKIMDTQCDMWRKMTFEEHKAVHKYAHYIDSFQTKVQKIWSTMSKSGARQ